MRFSGNLLTLNLENSISHSYAIGSLADRPMHIGLQKYQLNDNLDRQMVKNAIDKKSTGVYFIPTDEAKEPLIVKPGSQNHQKNSIFHSQFKIITFYKQEIAA
jgi:hypothetical protein